MAVAFSKPLAKGEVRNLLELPLIPWENPEVVWKHPEGAYSVVKCDTQWDYNLETYFLAHCLGTKNYDEFSQAHTVYSIRDKFGIPHATILCLKSGKFSPYGSCWDLGTPALFRPLHRAERKREKPLRILQVRGRQDDVAMEPFMEIAQEWFVLMGGDMAPFDKWNQAIERWMDTDYLYHFRYLLDESCNRFEWTHGNRHKRFLAELDGSSL